MQLKDLFDLKFSITEEALSDTQKDNAFKVSCLVFFSEVKITLLYQGDVDIYVGYKDEDDDLEFGLGDIQIKQIFEDTTTGGKFIRVVPLDYDEFDLPIEYNDDFMLVCEYVILSTSLKNLNMLKSLGIDESIQNLPMDIQAIKEILNKKYNVFTGNTIT